MNKIKVGIAGGAGYTGGETIRLMLHHPHAELTAVHSRSNAGQPLHAVHTDLLGDTDLLFTDTLPDDLDLIFLCLGHGESRKFLDTASIPAHTRIIDLSQDFRLRESATHGDRKFVYGLPEAKRTEILSAQNIANPGCFATAIQLALLPLAANGLLRQAYVTGITGSTGAGQSLSPTSHFSFRSNNIQAYKTLTHQHLAEIGETLTAGGSTPDLHFVPWRGDFTRGIFVSATVPYTGGLEEAKRLYESHYAGHPFTHLTPTPLALKQVVNTNKCLIQLEYENSHLVVHAAIDNLLKGASGQAVQNMNLLFGWDEKAGLRLKPAAF